MHVVRISRVPAAVTLSAFAFLAACHSGTEPTQTDNGCTGVCATTSQDITVGGIAAASEYAVIVANTTLDGTSKTQFSLTGTGIGATASLVPTDGASAARIALGMDESPAPMPDRAFEDRLRTTERTQLRSRFDGARAWRASLAPTTTTAGGFTIERHDMAVPAGVKVGDLVTVNVNGIDACTNPIYHAARVVAIGSRALIVADTLNPKNGFTTTDYQRYATKFDTLVFPLDSSAFGAPTDIDANGHIVLVFTRAVNELTQANSSSFVGGFTFSRDLFPIAGSARTGSGCTASNEGEYFYLLAPDPLGEINGNKRTTGFVDTTTTVTIAHEFEHLINGARRIYVNTAATDFEAKWLDEGLAHIAEELLFYRESGYSPRSNLDIASLRASQRTVSAYNMDMTANAGRYRLYLQNPSNSSPYAGNDSLTTRGGAWNLLRYLADQKATADNDIWFRLVNSTTSGVTNAAAVFGSLPTQVRDWNVSHAVDDISAEAAYQQKSWNWHSIYPNLGAGGLSYPLAITPMANGSTYAGSVMSGGAAYYRMAVPAGVTATLSFKNTTTPTGTNLHLVVVRTK